MFAFVGLLTLLLALAGLTCCFESSKPERVLTAMLSAPMLAFGNVQFSKGWTMGSIFAGLAAAALFAGGLPLVFSILILQVACVACWDDFVESEEIPAIVVVEEYVDEVADDARRQLAKALAQAALAKARIKELEAEVQRRDVWIRRRDRKIAELEKPKPQEMLKAAEELQEIFGTQPLDPRDPPHPNVVREIAYA